MLMIKRLFWLAGLALLLAACSPSVPALSTKIPGQAGTSTTSSTSTPTVLGQAGSVRTASSVTTVTPVPSATPIPNATATATPLPTPTLPPTPDVRPSPAQWSSWPVIPTVSAVSKAIYARGQTLGMNSHAFSVVGDCQSEPNVFLGIYETKNYRLPKENLSLQETIDYYNGSYSRQSMAVANGLSAPSALSPQWANPKVCQANESPVECELRVNKPAIVIINLGTNWRGDASSAAYEKYLHQIIDLVIAKGALPVLSTKVDNIEGGNRINLVTAQVAHDYDIPLWNFWLEAQALPNHGLDASRDNVYLTVIAWDYRNFSGLSMLDSIRRALAAPQP